MKQTPYTTQEARCFQNIWTLGIKIVLLYKMIKIFFLKKRRPTWNTPYTLGSMLFDMEPTSVDGME